MRRPFTPAFAAVIALATAPALAGQAAPPSATRGQIALEVARAAGLRLPAAGAEQAALQALRARGIDLGSNPARPATEADLVRVGAALGVAVTAARPAAPVSPGQAKAFAQSLRGPAQLSLAMAAQGGTGEIRISCQGRNSRAERKGTPASQANPNATAPSCEEEPVP